jgi:hypothetical protein
MRWALPILLISMLAACGLTWPGLPWPEKDDTCRGFDYSTLDTCKGCWGRFTDSAVASAEDDHCDAAGQDGEDPLTWQAAVVADAGDVPTGSPAGSDSTLHDGTVNSIGAGAETGWTHDDLSVGGWWKPAAAADQMLIRRGAGVGDEGDWSLRCIAASDLVARVSGTENDAGGAGPACPATTWSFLGFTYDGATGSDNIETYSSQSAGTATLLDCNGAGSGACQSDLVGPHAGAEAIGLHSNAATNLRFTGNTYEQFLCEQVFTEEQWCEICRCGFYADNASDRKAACNGCSLGSLGRSAWIPWPGPIWPDS